MIRKLLNLHRRDPAPEPRALSIHEFAERNSDVVSGYKLCATMAPSTPLKYLSRHGERRSRIPEEEELLNSPYFIWLPEVSGEFAFLDRGATMSSSVGYVPTDGGDFLPYLIEIRKIVERPRDLSLSELDDVYARSAEISRIDCGYGYSSDADCSLVKHTQESGRENYYQILSQGGPRWAFGFVLQELASCPHDGLTLTHIEELHQRGYGSIREMVGAPDEVLLSLKGIGKKRLERIRANKER